MKKTLLVVFLSLSALSFSMNLKIKSELPRDIEKEIRRAVASSSEKREKFKWFKESYLSLVQRLDESGIPQQDVEVIARRLHSMYGSNYPKQLAALNDELQDYRNLVDRIRNEQKATQEKIRLSNEKSKKEIIEILENTTISKNALENIRMNAEKEYPNEYNLQKAYIKGAINTYEELKNMIKK